MSDPSFVRSAPSSSSPSSSSASLSALPPAVLAVVCRQLPVAELLRLLRCCAPLHRLAASDASFSRAVWSQARLDLVLERRVHDWALPRESCVAADEQARDKWRIPLSLWQEALPVMRYTLEHWNSDEKRGAWLLTSTGSKMDWEPALAAEQPTMTVRHQATDHVVLSELTQESFIVPWPATCFRSRFVLRATPQLQRLHLAIDAKIIKPPPAVDIFSFVPRLRSLHLQQRNLAHCRTERPIVPIRDMLALLPSLTSLRCTDFHLSVQDLIDVAAHATLTHIRVRGLPAYFDQTLLGRKMRFSSKTAPSSDRVEEARQADHDKAAYVGVPNNDSRVAAAHDKEAERNARDMQRLQTALGRVTPSQRSIHTRLALADFLHDTVHPTQTEFFRRPFSELRHYRQQIAALRASLLDQLASSASAVDDEHSEWQRSTKHDWEWHDEAAEASDEDGIGDDEVELEEERWQLRRALRRMWRAGS